MHGGQYVNSSPFKLMNLRTNIVTSNILASPNSIDQTSSKPETTLDISTLATLNQRFILSADLGLQDIVC